MSEIMEHSIQPTTGADLAALKEVVEATGLFPGEMLAPMFGAGDGALWLTAHSAGRAAGFAVSRPEKMTEGTWNMLALAVLPARQRSGLGRGLVAASETALGGQGARLLLVDTSATAAFAGARAFYAAAGYGEVARIPGYWAEGDDRVTFAKRLGPRAFTMG